MHKFVRKRYRYSIEIHLIFLTFCILQAYFQRRTFEETYGSHMPDVAWKAGLHLLAQQMVLYPTIEHFCRTLAKSCENNRVEIKLESIFAAVLSGNFAKARHQLLHVSCVAPYNTNALFLGYCGIVEALIWDQQQNKKKAVARRKREEESNSGRYSQSLSQSQDVSQSVPIYSGSDDRYYLYLFFRHFRFYLPGRAYWNLVI